MFRFIFRLITFLIGISVGLITALNILPIPGNTIFNKMSRLPNGLKSLIDDAIELWGSFFNLSFAVSKDLYLQFQNLKRKVKARLKKVEERYRQNDNLVKDLKNILVKK